MLKSGKQQREVLRRERLQFQPQQLFIPAGVEREFVVGQHESTLLIRVQMIENDNRDVLTAELPRGQHAAMAGDDTAVPINQYRVVETELGDTGSDLRHLSVRMRARVPRIGDEPLERPPWVGAEVTGDDRYANAALSRLGPPGAAAPVYVASPLGFSEPGRQFGVFAGEAITEVKKVVWPTRKETMQTTAAVFAFVVVMAIFLWISDKTLEWVLYDLILGWKKT